MLRKLFLYLFIIVSICSQLSYSDALEKSVGSSTPSFGYTGAYVDSGKWRHGVDFSWVLYYEREREVMDFAPFYVGNYVDIMVDNKGVVDFSLGPTIGMGAFSLDALFCYNQDYKSGFGFRATLSVFVFHAYARFKIYSEETEFETGLMVKIPIGLIGTLGSM